MSWLSHPTLDLTGEQIYFGIGLFISFLTSCFLCFTAKWPGSPLRDCRKCGLQRTLVYAWRTVGKSTVVCLLVSWMWPAFLLFGLLNLCAFIWVSWTPEDHGQ